MHSCSRVSQRRRSSTFFCSRLKKLSMAALSPAAPTQPIDPTMPYRLNEWTNFLDLKGDPRWVCRNQPAPTTGRTDAIARAVVAKRDFIRESIQYPTMRLEN